MSSPRFRTDWVVVALSMYILIWPIVRRDGVSSHFWAYIYMYICICIYTCACVCATVLLFLPLVLYILWATQWPEQPGHSPTPSEATGAVSELLVSRWYIFYLLGRAPTVRPLAFPLKWIVFGPANFACSGICITIELCLRLGTVLGVFLVGHGSGCKLWSIWRSG